MKKPGIGFLLLWLLINTSSLAQADSLILKTAVQKLDKALVQKDEVVLQTVLHKNISYGHSNGWVQNKTDVLNDFISGKLDYRNIESNGFSILDMTKNRATVKMNSNAEGTVNGNSFKLNLHVLQVWLKTKKGWQLYSRQSAKQG